MAEISTKPYMLRAIHEWCTDSGFTPYIAVSVDEHTIVPVDFVRAGEIVLNISSSATNRLEISNELVQFQARFNGKAQELSIPIDNVSAIYARENGHGMAFDIPKAMALVPDSDADTASGDSAVRLVSSEELDGSNEPVSEEVPSTPQKRPRPTLAAVPVSIAPTEQSDLRDESNDEPDPDDDGPPASADNGAGPARKPRGKPKLTRVK